MIAKDVFVNTKNNYLDTLIQFEKMIDIFPINYKEKNIAELIHEIRKKVFVIEQNVNPWEEFDEHEDHCHHYLAYYKNKAVGTARWRVTESGIKLERFSVLKEYRNQGIGKALLDKLVHDTLSLNKSIYLHSQTHTANFYERYGFVKTGEIFVEANIPHIKMYLPIE